VHSWFGSALPIFEESDVTRPKEVVSLLDEINPDQFYRTTLAPAIFGVGWQACRNKILARELPTPFGDPQGWTGRQILEHRAKMQALAKAKAAADAARPKQAQPAAFKKKTKKMKLRAPARGLRP
jgi:hypothetical protein